MLLDGAEPALLLALDEMWADHLANVKELRDGIHWRSWGGREPFYEFVRDAEEMYQALLARVEELQAGEEPLPEQERGATWTYVVTDQPFGRMGDRIAGNLRQRLRDSGVLRG